MRARRKIRGLAAACLGLVPTLAVAEAQQVAVSVTASLPVDRAWSLLSDFSLPHNYVPDIQSAARGGYGADQEGPKMIEVGSGEAIMNKHLENYYRLTGLMRETPGPTGFRRESRWIMQEVPRD